LFILYIIALFVFFSLFCGLGFFYSPFAFLYTFAVCNRRSIDKAETKRSGIAAPFRFMIES